MKRLFFFLSLTVFATSTIAAGTNEIKSESMFNALLADNNGFIVIKFAADWCGACQAVKKTFEDIAENKDFSNVTFYTINIDTLPELTKKYNIIGVPTFIFIHNKKEIKRESGIKNSNTFEKEFTNNLKALLSKL